VQIPFHIASQEAEAGRERERARALAMPGRR